MDRQNRPSFPPWPSFVVLFSAAGYLALRWGDLPERWPVHWNASGQANGWSERSTARVFGLLVVDAAVLVFLESLLAVLSPVAPTDPKAPVRAAGRHFTRMVSFAMTLVLAFFSVALPLRASMLPGLVLAGCLAVLATATALGARRVSEAIREVREGAHPESVEGYRGLYYANPKDGRLWVPKISGIGATINFAHPMAWPVMIVLVGVPVGLAVVAIAMTR